MLKYSVLRGALQLIRDGGVAGELAANGITQEDFSLITGVSPWSRSDMARVQKVLGSLMQGALDVLEIGSFRLPSEYAAAIIAFFVHPVNTKVACHWIARCYFADDIIKGDYSVEQCRPEELYALVLAGYDQVNIEEFRSIFETKTARNLESLKNKVGSNEKKK